MKKGPPKPDTASRLIMAAEAPMPLICIHLVTGNFSTDQKRLLIERIAEAILALDGDTMQPVTWISVPQGDALNGTLAGMC